MLNTHRGSDPGTLELAGTMRQVLGRKTPLIASTTTRLLVDLNRSPDHPSVFGPSVQSVSPEMRARILAKWYMPHRLKVERSVERAVTRTGSCVHVGVHSFTPVLRGKRRDVDIGILFDPARAFESTVAAAWIEVLELMGSRLRVKENEPYAGVDDGLTTFLRTRFADKQYAGLELEVSQRLVRAGGERWKRLQVALGASLALAIELINSAG
jgi:predicted N-formylglutamate amidohydrolase